MNLAGRIKRRYDETGFLSIFQSGYKIGRDKVISNLLSSNPKLCQYITPKLGIICLELTNCCNLKCKMCPRDLLAKTRAFGFMDFTLFKKIVDQLDKNVVLSVYFAGEPLLHPKFTAMLDYAASKGFKEIRFTTNGMLLNEEKLDAVIRNNVDIRFSLEGLGQDNDNIRVGDNFQVILQNIQTVAKRKGKSKLSINLTACKTQTEIDKVVSFFKDTVDDISVIPLRDENLRVINEDFFNMETTPTKFCTMPFQFMGVLWNGDVTACCYDLVGKLIVGNVTETKLKDIWMGKPFKDLRYACLTNTFPKDSYCYTCNCQKLSFVNKTVKTNGLNVTYQEQIKLYARIP